MSGATSGVARAVLTGAIAGVLVSFYAISFALLIFAGTVPEAIPVGFWVNFTGLIVSSAFALWSWGRSQMLWQAQSIVVVTLASVAARFTTILPEASGTTLAGLIVAAIVITSLLTGLLMYVVGRVKRTRFVKNVPFPVVGGFLTATGTILIVNAAHLVLPTDPNWAQVFDSSVLARWSLPMLLAAAMIALQARWNIQLPLSLAAIGVIAVVYVVAALSPGGLSVALDGPMFLGVLVPQGTGITPPSPDLFGDLPYRALLREAPNLIVAAALALLGMLLNLSATEMSSGHTIDLDQEVRRAGAANLVTGLGGGMVSYQSASLSFLAQHLAPGAGRVLPATALITAGLIACFGIPHLAYIPAALIVFLLSYLGFGLLNRWFFGEIKRLGKGDILTILIIVAVTLLHSLLLAVLVGIAIAALNFTIAYSALPIFRSRATGVVKRSATERSEIANRLLDQHGPEVLIYELQGYLFFGTANRMYNEISANLTASPVPVRHVVIDFRRVLGTEVSAILMFVRLSRMIHEVGAELVVTALPAALSRETQDGDPIIADLECATLNEALARLEDDYLDAVDHEHVAEAGSAGSMRALLTRIEQEVAGVSFAHVDVAAGEVIFAAGDAADGFVLLEEGRLAATITTRSGSEAHVASYLAGAIVGEMGVVTGASRTATVRAQTKARICRVPKAQLEALRGERPDLALELTELLARLMAARLGRTTAELHAL